MGGIMGWKTLDDMDLTGKRVLTRVDINVPMQDGQVTDATRIEKIAPTVRDILVAGGTPILLAHFGRPKGERVDGMSLRHLVPALGTTPIRTRVICRRLRWPRCRSVDWCGPTGSGCFVGKHPFSQSRGKE
jgi:3-phosphoglycerate kinase